METFSYPGGVTWNRVSAELLAMGKSPFTVHSFMCLWGGGVGGAFVAFVCFSSICAVKVSTLKKNLFQNQENELPV